MHFSFSYHSCLLIFQTGHDIQFERSDDRDDVYQVIGSAGSHYTVDLQQPSCTCFDWGVHKLPCKHILAIVNRCPDATWETLPPSYRNGVFFVLDVPESSLILPDAFSHQDQENNQSGTLDTTPAPSEDATPALSEDATPAFSEALPSSSATVQNLDALRNQICKSLDRLRQYIYLQESQEILVDLHAKLESSQDWLVGNCQRSDKGLPV